MNNRTIVISGITETDTEIVLIPNREVKNLVNTGEYQLIIACNVNATANLPIFIQTTIGNIPVICRFGNTVYSSQLTKRTMYRIGYGNGNDNYTEGQFVIQSNVNPKSVTAPVQSI